MRAMPLQSLSAKTLAEDRPDRLTAMLPWLVGLLIILPLAFTDIPPLGDYPNHLARVTIMAALPNDPILSQFFEASYRPIPNLAFDLIVGPLSTILGVHAAGRVFVALTLLAGLGGVLCYHRALFQRVSIWPLVAGLFAFNQYLLSGFINFALGIGLAFGCAGISYSIRDRGARTRLLAQLIFVVVLYFTHLAGFIFYAGLLGMQELGWLWRGATAPSKCSWCAGPASRWPWHPRLSCLFCPGMRRAARRHQRRLKAPGRQSSRRWP